MPDGQAGVDQAVLRSAREGCHSARDNFYKCVEDQKVDFQLDSPFPEACQRQRQEFAKACKSSWVKHFDTLRDKEVRLVRTLHGNINRERDDRKRDRSSRRERSRERSPVRHEMDRDRRGRDGDRDRHRDTERDRHRDRDRDRGTRKDKRERDRSSRDEYREEREKDRDRQQSSDMVILREPKLEVRSKPDMSMAEADGESQENGGADGAALSLDADISPEEMQMMQAMGIPFGFDTTQGRHIQDNAANSGAVKVKQKRRARQYMNRRGGFNRALPPERTGETALRD